MACMKDSFIKGLILDGRYESVSPLNHGSFGMVFLAKDLTTNELVAIKCLTKIATSNGCPVVSKEEATLELACHDRLGHHPNIVNLLRAFETEAHTYLVLEFCSMGDLYEAIYHGHGPLETKNVREFMLQLVNAVDFMHSKGLYHRDIKPENIFLAQDGSMKLGDFGLATTDAWSYESSVGSDRYMAPEQYDVSETGYSPAKADTWAIGICLLNVLFSRNPFVTPTETDVLFADFARDNQSLFDVFPNMSQDTFEVLAHALALDPSKRSLTAVRESLLRVVTFTTDEESFDEFCTEERAVYQASSNREPLRTPSISSPQVDNGGAFPWAKALHMSPQRKGRQLSAIPDTESYSEDLFSGSENRDSWYSAAQNSSLTSGLDSVFGASVKSMVLNPPVPRHAPRSEPIPVSGSLPAKPSQPLPALSSIFGKQEESFSKSWTDLWDEDAEDVQREEALERRREQNSRTWSQDSKDNDVALIGRTGLSEIKSPSTVNSRTRSPNQAQAISSDAEGFAFDDTAISCSSPRYSPPSKRTIMDKWAILGNRRRAANQNCDENSTKKALTGNWRDGLGLKVWSGRSGRSGKLARPRKEMVNNKIRDWRRDTNAHQHDDGDLEWVGGWQSLHL